MRHFIIFSFCIGGIFDGDNSDLEAAFRNAIHRENKDTDKVEFIPIVRRIEADNSYEAEKMGS